MRALLTGGIKAILAIAALSTAAHWAMRVQRDAETQATARAAPQTAQASDQASKQVLARAAVPAGLPEPTTTGSIAPRRIEPAMQAAPVAVRGPEIGAVAGKAAQGKTSLGNTSLGKTSLGKASPSRTGVGKASQAGKTASGLDQTRLSALIASTAGARPKADKPKPRQ